MDSNPLESLPSPPESLPCRSSIFAHGVQEIIQMDLKTRPFMSPTYCPWHSWISGAQVYNSGVLFRGSNCGVLLELMSGVGVEAISNEHFRVHYTSNMHQTVIENRGL
ncbi:unnamed protein product, partial [Brassica oleracea var. botrytis]